MKKKEIRLNRHLSNIYNIHISTNMKAETVKYRSCQKLIELTQNDPVALTLLGHKICYATLLFYTRQILQRIQYILKI